MTANPRYAREAEEKSGQSTSPTLDVDGLILPDASVEQLAELLEQKGIEA